MQPWCAPAAKLPMEHMKPTSDTTTVVRLRQWYHSTSEEPVSRHDGMLTLVSALHALAIAKIPDTQQNGRTLLP